jgi:hypothetical protein
MKLGFKQILIKVDSKCFGICQLVHFIYFVIKHVFRFLLETGLFDILWVSALLVYLWNYFYAVGLLLLIVCWLLLVVTIVLFLKRLNSFTPEDILEEMADLKMKEFLKEVETDFGKLIKYWES